jgi:hypothetical protein
MMVQGDRLKTLKTCLVFADRFKTVPAENLNAPNSTARTLDRDR